MKISELLAWYGSDKWLAHHQHGHSYGPFYDELLAPLRESVRVVFEIGVLGGASLRAWRDFFPNARVIGLDINVEPYTEDRIEVFRGDATDPDTVSSALAGLDADLVIDDGSHWFEHQIKSFEIIEPLLADDGLFVIEDIQWHTVHDQFRDRGFTIHDFRQQRQRHDDVLAVFRKARCRAASDANIARNLND